VHNVSTRSQSTENQNMLTYHDPGSVHAPPTGFSCFSVNSQRDVPIINILFISSLLKSGYRVSKWPGCGFDRPPPSSADFKKRVQLNFYSSPRVFIVFSSVNFTFTFYIFLSRYSEFTQTEK